MNYYHYVKHIATINTFYNPTPTVWFITYNDYIANGRCVE